MSEKEKEYQKGRRNLILAVVASIPGPVVLALGLSGNSSITQLADFLRRSCELLSILLAFGVFERSHRHADCDQQKLEAMVRLVTGLSMVFSGIAIGWLAVSSFGAERGSVAASLVLALLGALVNARLYLSYRSLHHGVLSIQARLHWVKLLLDLWMAGVLLVITLSSGAVRSCADLVGSCSIAFYVTISGIRLLDQKEALQ